MKLAELGEFGLIDRLRRMVGQDPAGTLGIGDDCAVWSVPVGQQLLVTTDLLLEGTHFRRDWTDLHRLGRKAVAVNLSDIAAMGGTPRQLVLGLGLPGDSALDEVDALLAGFVEAAAEAKVQLVGGDTCRAQQFLAIAVTAFGTVPLERSVRRSTARPGDLLFVSGTLGDSALALQLLQQGAEPGPFLRQRHLDPVARVELGIRLAASGRVSAMLDISDGLAADLAHLLKNQVSGALLSEAAIPLSKSFKDTLPDLRQRTELALSGGEDYELLFTAADRDRDEILGLAGEIGVQVTPIGVLDNQWQGIWLERPDGATVAVGNRGFQHFSSQSDG